MRKFLRRSIRTPDDFDSASSNRKDTLQLYEKLYFHEADAREKLNGRLQTPLALIISLIGVIAFLLQNYEHRGFTPSATLFALLLTTAVLALIAAAYFFVQSWYDNTYSFLPSARVTEEYRQLLVETYKPYDGGEKLAADYFHDYILKSYIDSSSANTAVNDQRSINIHKTNGALIITAAITFVAFLVFFFGGLQKGRTPVPPEAKVTVTIKAEGTQMPIDTKGKPATPPPPPPPPPLRQIREGVEVVPPKNPPNHPKADKHDK